MHLALLAVALFAAAPPETPRKPVTDTYGDLTVHDDYRWLESGADPGVAAWSDAQNARTRAFLDALPGAAALRARVAELVKASSVRHFGLVERGGKLFAMRWDPRLQQPVLVVLRSPADAGSARALVDPNALDAKGGVTIDWFVPSNDGARVAVSLSKGGSESGDVHVYDVATGKEHGDVIARVHGGTAGGSLAWTPDGTGFWYTRYPREGERPAEDLPFWQQVWFHRLGAREAEDVQELGKGLPRIAETALETSRDGRWVVAQVRNGDGGEVAYFVRSTARGAAWTQLSRFEDEVVRHALGDDGALYVVSRKGAPNGNVLRVALATPRLAAARVVVPAGPRPIEDLVATRTRLVVHEIDGGPSRLASYPLAGGARTELPVPPIAAVEKLARMGADDLLFEVQSYVTPLAWWRLDGKRGTSARTALFQTSPVRYDDVEVVREVAVSKDGTKVPMTILRPRGTKLDGSGAALLYGYGGFGVNETPAFSPTRRLWLDRGGVWAVANLRGGGEFGEAWHQAGYRTRKQNVFDDFDACARRLVELGYTRPERLSALGGSNGGLLMGAVLTQHPELYRAIVSFVGVYDMLRVESTPNGAFNVTEYGTVKDPEERRALYAYSPYHHVKDGARYPAVLLATGENDPRVDPWHSRKFAARLQAANPSGLPILLRTSRSSGHGIGSALDEVIAERADMLGFLFHELGMEPPATPTH